jgi:hypothetical protein
LECNEALLPEIPAGRVSCGFDGAQVSFSSFKFKDPGLPGSFSVFAEN